MGKRLFLLLVIGIAAIGDGQTTEDLSARYRPITVYQLRPEVTMTPQYADDGSSMRDGAGEATKYG
jgi:hypothetical protein